MAETVTTQQDPIGVGVLDKMPLPELIRGLYRERRSGVLDLQRDGDQRRIYFVGGEVKSAISNDIGQKVGQYLKKSGLVVDRQIQEALGKKKSGLRLGHALVQLGAIDRETLERELRKLVAEIVYAAFAWERGRFRFALSEDPVPADVMLSLSTANVIMEAIRRLPSDDSILAHLGDLNARLKLASDPFLRLQHITLTPDEGFFVSRIDGATSIDLLLKTGGLPRERGLRLVYGLIATGIAQEPPRASGPEPTVVPGKIVSALSGLNVQIAPKRTTAAFLAPQPTSAPDMLKEEVEFRRRKVKKVYEQLATLAAHEILEVPLNPTFREVRSKFNELAELYHPDLAFRPEYADLKPQLSKLFQKLEEAYRVMAHRAGGAATLED